MASPGESRSVDLCAARTLGYNSEESSDRRRVKSCRVCPAALALQVRRRYRHVGQIVPRTTGLPRRIRWQGRSKHHGRKSAAFFPKWHSAHSRPPTIRSSRTYTCSGVAAAANSAPMSSSSLRRSAFGETGKSLCPSLSALSAPTFAAMSGGVG